MKFYYTYMYGESDSWYDCESYELYDTFDKVCNELDKEITTWLSAVDEDETYTPPDRNQMLEQFGKRDRIYYYSYDMTTFLIKKMRVAE